jgi:hypothetical protein
MRFITAVIGAMAVIATQAVDVITIEGKSYTVTPIDSTFNLQVETD